MEPFAQSGVHNRETRCRSAAQKQEISVARFFQAGNRKTLHGLTMSPLGRSLIATSRDGSALRSRAFTTIPNVPCPSRATFTSQGRHYHLQICGDSCELLHATCESWHSVHVMHSHNSELWSTLSLGPLHQSFAWSSVCTSFVHLHWPVMSYYPQVRNCPWCLDSSEHKPCTQ